MTDPNDGRWRRLMVLLEPMHEQAVATARRLSRSQADGDDLYHEALLQAFERIHFLRDESRFRSWFYAVLFNRHRDRSRRSFWRRFLPWEAAFPDGDPAITASEDAEDRVTRAGRASRALATLPPEQREAIVLFEIEGWSIEEIAASQTVTLSAVKSRLARGRERLRRWYERLEALASHAGAPRASDPPLERERRDELSPWAPAPATGKERSDV